MKEDRRNKLIDISEIKHNDDSTQFMNLRSPEIGLKLDGKQDKRSKIQSSFSHSYFDEDSYYSEDWSSSKEDDEAEVLVDDG